MRLKKYNEVLKLTNEVLSQELKSAKERMIGLKFEHKVKGLSDPTSITHLRREIAQMSTEISKRNNIKN